VGLDPRPDGQHVVTSAREGVGVMGAPATYEVVTTLIEAERTSVYRGRRSADGLPVVLKVPRAGQAHPSELERLEHEYEVLGGLDTRAVVKPLGIDCVDGRPALVLEDFGGVCLADLVGVPLEVGRFLRLAVGIAAALAEVHQSGVIHKDVKPHNILVDEAKGEVRLTDFGIASTFPREYPAAVGSNLLQGTPAYMAPEQTGRMNRGVDQRADLYALGVTFYQMLTGRLPFVASDPMEWVHCHLARMPAPPSHVVPGLPEVLSRLVMKLLAKAPEDRYQSARGLREDLASAWAAFRTTGQIETFALGERDFSGELRIPQKLYGRAREAGVLLGALRRIVAGGAPEVVLVAGGPGVGKSTLVRELQKCAAIEGALFLSGKFEERRQSVPYSALAQAFRGAVADILSESDEEVVAWRRRLLAALGPSGQLIVDIIPELELVIGKQPPVTELGPSEAQTRFSGVLRRFIGAFASKEHPSVLFLDDLQWADSGTLALVEQLGTDDKTPYLLLIGAYRDKEIPEAHPLRHVIDGLRQSGRAIDEILLGPLRYEDVGELVADTFRNRAQAPEPLAALVHEKTGGNPFFIVQFLATLHQERLVVFDYEAAAWRWDVTRIAQKGFSSNVVELMVTRVAQLPLATRDTLMLVACAGTYAEVSLLAAVADRSEQAIVHDLAEAVRSGLLLRAGDVYAFAHDRVRQAAFLATSEGHLTAVHLKIGRLLLARTPPGEIEGAVFEIVTHMNAALSLVEDESERQRIVDLDVVAARKAKSANAYPSALTYAAYAESQLGPDAWQRQYETAFALSLLRAECEFLSGNHDEAVRLASSAAQGARTKIDRVSAVLLEQAARRAKGELAETVASELSALALFGIELPAHPTRAEVFAEQDRVRSLLDGRPIEAIADLPLLEDAELAAAMRISATSYFTDVDLWRLQVSRMVALSLAHGNSDSCVLWYGGYSLVLAFQGEYEDADRFARVAYRLMEQRGDVASRGRAHFFLTIAFFWTRPVAETIAHARAGFTAAVETGDLIVAAYCADRALGALLTQGESLERLDRELEGYLEFARAGRLRDIEELLSLTRQFIRSQEGRTASLDDFTDATFAESEFRASLDQRMPFVACVYWALQLRASLAAGAYDQAVAAGAKAKALAPALASHSTYRDIHFYYALALASAAMPSESDRASARRELLSDLRAVLAGWSAMNPATFRHSEALVAAEMARLEGAERDAARLYEESIHAARDGGFLYDEALACELAARFYRTQAFSLIADTYLREARRCYLRWGGLAKARQLERSHPELAEAGGSFLPTATFVSRSEQIDLLAAVTASQAISREVVREKLVQTLMRVVLEQSGAERGLLIVPREEGLLIEAEATARQAGVEVKAMLGQSPSERTPLASTVVQYVMRTAETVVLDEAGKDPRFADDDYVRRARPRSVLLLPISRAGKIMSLLYLENNALPGVFTSERLVVLKLLAGQAAVSLENARALEQERAARAAAEEAVRLRDEFLAVASHELSTPMTSIMLTLQGMLAQKSGSKSFDPELLLRLAAVAERQGRKFTRLIRDLVEVARAEQTPIVLNLSYGDLALLVEKAKERFEVEAAQAGCKLIFRATEPVMGRWDPPRIEQVVSHLLSNAVKFGAGRPVEVEVKRMGEIARVLVTDHGIGIERARQPRIFDRFERGVPVTHYGGLGLGLYLSRRIAEAHGGHLTVESEPGEGTTFTVDLPGADSARGPKGSPAGGRST
jgi:predicted ATPase/signal transduction histidine kinase